MSQADLRLAEDKALRDAALGVFQADLRFIREDLDQRGIGGRIADRLGDATLDMVDEAVDYAEGNKGQVAAALAAIVLWFGRSPILHGLERMLGIEDDGPEQDGGDSRSDND
jgi:hypothetical protein